MLFNLHVVDCQIEPICLISFYQCWGSPQTLVWQMARKIHIFLYFVHRLFLFASLVLSCSWEIIYSRPKNHEYIKNVAFRKEIGNETRFDWKKERWVRGSWKIIISNVCTVSNFLKFQIQQRSIVFQGYISTAEAPHKTSLIHDFWRFES